MEERRKNKRYMLNNVCIINHSRAVGTIIDLSVGGMSCMCLDQGECEEGLVTKIDVYCKSSEVRAKGIDMKVMSTGMHPGKFMLDLGIRKCRGRFCHLDEDQKKQLEKIIGLVPDSD